MLRAMEAAASDSGLIPEQVWTARRIREELHLGRPTGSAAAGLGAREEHVEAFAFPR